MELRSTTLVPTQRWKSYKRTKTRNWTRTWLWKYCLELRPLEYDLESPTSTPSATRTHHGKTIIKIHFNNNNTINIKGFTKPMLANHRYTKEKEDVNIYHRFPFLHSSLDVMYKKSFPCRFIGFTWNAIVRRFRSKIDLYFFFDEMNENNSTLHL